MELAKLVIAHRLKCCGLPDNEPCECRGWTESSSSEIEPVIVIAHLVAVVDDAADLHVRHAEDLGHGLIALRLLHELVVRLAGERDVVPSAWMVLPSISVTL